MHCLPKTRLTDTLRIYIINEQNMRKDSKKAKVYVIYIIDFASLKKYRKHSLSITSKTLPWESQAI